MNPANGGLSIRIGVPQRKRLGPQIPFNFAYDSSGVFNLSSPYPYPQWLDSLSALSQGGWSYTLPTLSIQNHQFESINTGSGLNDYPNTCDAFTDYVFQDANGGRQNLGLLTWDNSPSDGCAYQNGPNGTPPVVNNSGTGYFPYLAVTTTPGSGQGGSPQPVDVIDADGNDYYFPRGNVPPAGPPCPHPTAACQTGTFVVGLVTDRNGNTWQPGVQVQIPTFGSNPDTITVAGLANPYLVNWTTVSANFAVNMTFFPFDNQDNSRCQQSGASTNGGQPAIQAVSSVTLPNGQSYLFDYSNNSYGMVDKITYPTGGYIRYVWGLNTQAAFFSYLIPGPSVPILSPDGVILGYAPPTSYISCAYQYDVPAVTKRFVSFDGVHEVEEQDFTYTTNWAPAVYPQTGFSGVWATKQTTVITKDLVRNTQHQTLYTYTSAPFVLQPNSAQTSALSNGPPVESSVQYFDNNGALLQTVNKSWQNERLMVQQTTTLNNVSPALTSESDWKYDCNEMLTEHDDYDFGSGSDTVVLSGNCATGNSFVAGSGSRGTLLRKTIYPSYHAFTGQSGTVAHIVDKPDSIQVLDSSGVVAGVSYTYDNTINPTTGYPNANLLTRSNLVTPSGSALTTTHHYDSFGNMDKTWDPQGNLTTYSYADSFVDASTCAFPSPSNTFLTNITYPTTSNGVPHSENFKYWCATGELAQSTDENSQTTSYIYNDPFNRLTETDYPSGWGKSTVTYNDTPGAVSVETKRLDQSGNIWADSIGYFDNMAHQVGQSSISGETAGWNHSDTCLDGLGEVRISTYAYQSNSAAGDPNCSHPGDATNYDALGRVISVTHSDSTSATTTYIGRSVDVKDEGSTSGSIERISQSDALGRLISVCEVTGQTQADSSPGNCNLDAPGTGFLTNYQYSAVGDLQSVQQGNVARSFVYDMTSRLTQANNPESGQVTYTYDADSNCPQSYLGELISKTDGLGKTCMQYDALHRLTNKTYLDGVTPNVTYAYDETSALGVSLTNTVGRKSSERTISGGNVQTGSVFSYDTLGHVVDNSQCTPQNCGSGVFPVQYTGYNVLGEPASATNGAGVTLAYGYNNAGKLTSVSSSLNDSNHPGTLLSGVHYNAFGSLYTSTIGNGLNDARSYDARGRLNTMVVGSGSGTQSSGTITVSGSEQGPHTASGWVQIWGESYPFDVCDDSGDNCNEYWDQGVVGITVGSDYYWYSYGEGDQAATTVIPALVDQINSVGHYTATANLSTNTLYITSVATGTAANVSFSFFAYSYDGETYFSGYPSGPTLTGGASGPGGLPADTGTISVLANGNTSTASYGYNDTPATVAASLAAAINSSSPSITAAASGTTVTLTSTTPGASTNYAITSWSASAAGYSSASFSATSTTLSGGTGGTIYTMALARLPDGGITQSYDSVNGAWAYAYDGFDRLSAAGSSTGYGCQETYDRYGNRLAQTAVNGYSCGSTPQLSPSGNNDNRLAGFAYNNAGAILNDGLHSYAYDAENRVATVDSGGASYVYDASGQRVRKTTSGGTVDYIYDLSGHVIAEMNSSGGWNRGEIYAGGAHIATYDNGTTYFNHADWLGTERVRTNVAAGIYTSWTSLPFGEGSASANPGPTHFTGKERDTESGLDYFGARYYASSIGRFMSPDWAAKAEPVPYAKLDDPQSLNLYSYVYNNPLSRADADGHWPTLDQVRTGLDVVGFIPVVGDVANVASAGISAYQGHYGDAALSLAAAVPIVGLVGEAAKGAELLKDAKVLTRLGTDAESAARLGRKAAEAEKVIGIHGVSTTEKAVEGGSKAAKSEVENAFKVHDTPTNSDPLHKTVELPKPVTKEIADTFNKIFGRK